MSFLGFSNDAHSSSRLPLLILALIVVTSISAQEVVEDSGGLRPAQSDDAVAAPKSAPPAKFGPAQFASVPFPDSIQRSLSAFFRNDSRRGNLGKYPFNITDAFKGTWDFGTFNASNELEYEKKSGVVFFHIACKRTESEDRHEVQAEMLMRDGIYPTPHDIRTSLNGFYTWKTGQLVLFSDLFGAVISIVDDLTGENVTIARDSIESLTTNLRHSSLSSHDPNGISLRPASHRKSCMFHLFIQLKPVQHELPEEGEIDDQKPSEMEGVMISPNCLSGNGISLNATAVLFETYFNKAINYTLMVTFISFIEVLLLIRQMEYTNTQSSASKVSLLTIGQQAIMDSYLCLLHLTTGIVVERLFNAFATAAFFKFVIFAIFEMRYLLTIWKARRPQQFNDGWNAMRRELSMLYSRFYGFLLAGILLMYQMQGLLKYFIFVLYSFWVPQIINNIQRDSRRALHTYYVVGMSLTRLAIPMYFYACPYNFLHIEANFVLGGWLCAWVAVQVVILLLQNYLGPRFLIPARFLPAKYNYYRLYSGPSGECVICMQLIDDNDRMITPCDHLFHPQCLHQWMDIKMECPTCRRSLPAV